MSIKSPLLCQRFVTKPLLACFAKTLFRLRACLRTMGFFKKTRQTFALTSFLYRDAQKYFVKKMALIAHGMDIGPKYLDPFFALSEHAKCTQYIVINRNSMLIFYTNLHFKKKCRFNCIENNWISL